MGPPDPLFHGEMDVWKECGLIQHPRPNRVKIFFWKQNCFRKLLTLQVPVNNFGTALNKKGLWKNFQQIQDNVVIIVHPLICRIEFNPFHANLKIKVITWISNYKIICKSKFLILFKVYAVQTTFNSVAKFENIFVQNNTFIK